MKEKGPMLNAHMKRIIIEEKQIKATMKYCSKNISVLKKDW